MSVPSEFPNRVDNLPDAMHAAEVVQDYCFRQWRTDPDHVLWMKASRAIQQAQQYMWNASRKGEVDVPTK